eukprot:gene138-88_t
MGNCYTVFYKRKFVVNEDIEGQGRASLEVFTLLGLSPNDVDLLYTAFWDIDADGSGLIRPTELFSYFEVEGTKFERGVFTLFDEDHSELLEMMHCKKIDKDPALTAVYNKMRKELGNAFTIHEFNKWTAANPHVVSPVMMLQLHIRLQIIGETFWSKLALQRKEHPEQGQLDYVKKLQDFVIRKNDIFKEKLAMEEAERRRMSRLGRGRMGDCRNNVTRKQSVLLGYFNMKQPAPATGVGRLGKSLSRVFVLDDGDADEDDGVVIAGGQSASGKRRNPNGHSAKGTSPKADSGGGGADPFLESDIRNKAAPSTATSASSSVSANNGTTPPPGGPSSAVVASTATATATAASASAKKPTGKIRTIAEAKGDNRRRRSSIKPNLVREAADRKRRQEDKYKATVSSNGKKTSTGSSGKQKNKPKQTSSGTGSGKNGRHRKKVAPSARGDDSSDSDADEDYGDELHAPETE